MRREFVEWKVEMMPGHGWAGRKQRGHPVELPRFQVCVFTVCGPQKGVRAAPNKRQESYGDLVGRAREEDACGLWSLYFGAWPAKLCEGAGWRMGEAGFKLD